MYASKKSKGQYLLSVEEIPADVQSFPAYFIGSTAPNNVEDGISGGIENPQESIEKIAGFLCAQAEPHVLIAVHGYNTALGEFASAQPLRKGRGVKGWYQEIRNHIEGSCSLGTEGLVLIGYRWPSEQINGKGNDRFSYKLRYARRSLPVVLKAVLLGAIALLLSTGLVALIRGLSESDGFDAVVIIFLILAIVPVSIVFTLFLLRIVGYFRDSYRATNYGVPDLVELIRQLDKAILAANPDRDWSGDEAASLTSLQGKRVKLSFIGHSMGGFVVTNTVRILSDVFDRQSIGGLGVNNKTKAPSPDIGNVFSLGQLVLVSPDIPAETIISGRANFLSSSLRRFQETYLFSNEGDMALKLASTAANYASFPAKTREGGYRLGNVVIRMPNNQSPQLGKFLRYGIVNFDSANGGALLTVPFLDYLYILSDTSLSKRQQDILEPSQKPIAELFTVFDCTDYYEDAPDSSGRAPKKVGLLTRALGKRSLSLWDYAVLTIDMFTGRIDTHSGYFHSKDVKDAKSKPDARLTKQLIYGLACLGFGSFLASLSTDSPSKDRSKELRLLSGLCANHHIQVLLAAERYEQDVLGLAAEGDREGY